MARVTVPRGAASFPQLHRFSPSERCRLVSAKGPGAGPIVLVSGPPLGLALAVALFLALLSVLDIGYSTVLALCPVLSRSGNDRSASVIPFYK